MLVTSDCHPLEEIAPYLPYGWQEILVSGVGIYGRLWPGASTMAGFLHDAARIAGVEHSADIGGYTLTGETRTRNLKPKSLQTAIERAERNDRDVSGVLLAGMQPLPGGASNNERGLFVGGEAGRLNDSFRASFVFPASDEAAGMGETLLKLAATALNAEYGYYFVRDDALLPSGYALGWIGGLAAISIREREELEEIAHWGEVTRGEYWDCATPPLRDVYEVNLLSRQHLDRRIGAITLFDWIQNTPERGALSELTPGRFLWKLSSRQVERVRPELMLAGALFSRHERHYRRG